MKKHFLKFSQVLVLSVFLLMGINSNAQTFEQTRTFLNRSHVAIMKVEKEMYHTGNTAYVAELKKAIKYQMIAVNSCKDASNYKNAVGNSFKSRSICMEICNKMNIGEGVMYKLNDQEKTFCDPANYTNLSLNASLLTPDQTTQVDNVDVMDVQKFHQLVLNVK